MNTRKQITIAVPIGWSSDFTAWYAPAGNLALLLVAALAGYGFFTALAGRPVFRQWLAAPGSPR